jgi:alpha-glucoside transport system permease protein
VTRPLLGESVVIDDVGPARRGRVYPAAGAAGLLLLPAVVLLGALIAWPVVRIVYASVTDPAGGFVGLDNFRAALDAPGTAAVVGRTLLWALVVPVVVTGLGLLLATTSRRTPRGRLIRFIVIAPIALPLVVTGVAYRIMYDPDPGRGTVSALLAWMVGAESTPLLLGPRLITYSLMSAFVWAWVGLAFIVLRTALATVPHDLADAVRAYGGTPADVFRDARWRPLLRRTVAVVFVLVALGTVRTFDLILVMAPGSVLDESSVLAVRVFQTSGATTTGPGAALGVLWLVAVALGVAGAALGSRQVWPPPSGPDQPGPVAGQGWRAVLRRSVPVAVAVVWLGPLVVLVATSLHRPRDTATRPWWAATPSLDSYSEVFRRDLLGSLVFTAALATVVTLVVLVIALCAAYPFASMSGPGAQVAGALALAGAVVPIQVIAGPVNEVLGQARVAGTAVGVALVHIALGLPFAVMVLRNAFADVPVERLRRARLAGRGELVVVWHLARATVPAVVAVAALEFVQVWNDLVVGLLFSGPDKPLGLFLYGQSRQFVASSGVLAAGSVVVSVLPVLVLVLARRQVIAGLISGTLR